MQLRTFAAFSCFVSCCTLVNAGALIRSFVGHTGIVHTICFDPFNTTRFVTAGLSDFSVKLWSTSSGTRERSLVQVPSRKMNAATFSADTQNEFFTADQANQVIVWSGTTGQPFYGHSAFVWSVTSDPANSSRLLSAGDDGAMLWEKPSGQYVRIHNTASYGITVNPVNTSEILTAARDGTAMLWDRSGTVLRTFSGHANEVTVALFNPFDANEVLTASYDSTLKLWNKSTGALIRNFTGHSATVRAVAFNPQTRYEIASASWDGTVLRWDTRTGAVLENCTLHAGNQVYSVVYNPANTSQLVSSDGGGNVYQWEITPPSAPPPLSPSPPPPPPGGSHLSPVVILAIVLGSVLLVLCGGFAYLKLSLKGGAASLSFLQAKNRTDTLQAEMDASNAARRHLEQEVQGGLEGGEGEREGDGGEDGPELEASEPDASEELYSASDSQ